MYIGIFVIFNDISGFQRHGFLQIISIYLYRNMKSRILIVQ
jgi:hypothetical protein